MFYKTTLLHQGPEPLFNYLVLNTNYLVCTMLLCHFKKKTRINVVVLLRYTKMYSMWAKRLT